MPLAAVRHERARQSSATAPCGNCRRVLGVPDPLDQYSWTIRFIKKPGKQDQDGLNVAKSSSDRLPRSQSSGSGPSASCWYCCPLYPHGGLYPAGKIALSSPRGELGTYDMCRVPLAAESQAKFRPCRDCRRFL